MQKRGGVVQSKGGRVVVGAIIQVFLAGTSTPATIFADKNGTEPIQQLESDNEGEFSFYAPNGRYDIKTVINGRVDGQYLDELLFDPADVPDDSDARLDAVESSVSSANESLAGLNSTTSGLNSRVETLESMAQDFDSAHGTEIVVGTWPDGTTAPVSALGDDDGAAKIGYAQSTVGQTLDTMTSDNGSASIGFIQSGTGAASRKAQDKLRTVISIKDFGASPSKTAAENDLAIQRAIDAATLSGNGYQTASARRVFCESGVYQVSRTFNLPNGLYLDGEAPGTVIFQQQDITKTTFDYVDAVTGVDQTLTIKRIVVAYPSLAGAGTVAIRIKSSTAIAPVLEDVTTFNARIACEFGLTINLSMNRCYAINGADGFTFTTIGDGHNSCASITACYAAGCSGYGFIGALIGSTLSGVAADRCQIGYSMKLLDSTLLGSTEACTAIGAVFDGSSSSNIQLYVVTANGASDGIHLLNSTDIVLMTPKVTWGGGGTGYGLRVAGTSDRITVINPTIDQFGGGRYNDTSKVTFIGPGISKGVTAGALPQAFSAGFSGGSGVGGANHSSGFRVGADNGYGISLEAWDSTTPRAGWYGYNGTTAAPIMEIDYLSTDLLFGYKPVLKSPNGTKYRVTVSDAGALTTTVVV